MVVHDQASVANPNVIKLVNWNFGAAVARDGDVFSSTVGKSRLFMKSLVPADPKPTIARYGENGAFQYQASLKGNRDDTFLHVFQATDATAKEMIAVDYVSSADGKSEGVQIKGTTLWVAMFGKSDAAESLDYQASLVGAQQHLIADLKPNSPHHVTVAAGTTLLDSTVTANAQGVLAFAFTNTAPAHVIVGRE